MTTDVRFTVEVETRGSNAREHWTAHAARVERERDAVAAVWKRLMYRVECGVGVMHPECFDSYFILRVPRGTSRDARALAKKTGADLRVMESVLKPRFPIEVHLTRVSAGELDPRNLDHALKGIIDQLAREMGVDDNARSIAQFFTHQERGPRKYHAVKVRIVARAQEATG